jgi:hypothetical protein
LTGDAIFSAVYPCRRRLALPAVQRGRGTGVPFRARATCHTLWPLFSGKILSALLLRHKLKKIPKYRTKSRATMKNLGLGVVHVTVGPAQGSKAGMGCATGQLDERREEVV